jgi:pimeloyl-ACP methyl ester carboxylesterase
MLARHGYGVLLYDARGRGQSEGAPEGFGWTWQRDLDGALAFLKRRPDVDPARVGGLGLSTGAEVLVQAAAQRADLHAVVADGVEARTARETARVGELTETANFAAMMLANRVLADAGPPPDLGELVGRVRAPTLLIASGTSSEAAFGLLYAERSHGRARLWAIPDAAHTKGLRTHPEAYTSRVTRFFDAALLSRR